MTVTATAIPTKLSHADTMRKFGLKSCDFVYNCESGIEFTVYAEADTPVGLTCVTPLFDYNSDEQEEAIKAICLAIVDEGFADIHNMTEVGGTFTVDGDDIVFEGNVTTVLTGLTTTIS